jgi:hypothetical protein
VIHRPSGMGAFQFVVLATLRAAQLMQGCRPRVDGVHKATIIAQFEVAQGKVKQLSTAAVDAALTGDSEVVLAAAVAADGV